MKEAGYKVAQANTNHGPTGLESLVQQIKKSDKCSDEVARKRAARQYARVS